MSKTEITYIPVTPGGTFCNWLEADTEEQAIQNLIMDAAHMPYKDWEAFEKRGYWIAEETTKLKYEGNLRHIWKEWEDNKDIFHERMHWHWSQPLHSTMNFLTESNRWLPYIKSHTWDLLIIAIAIGGWIH